MRKSEISELFCPVARAISNVGDHWSLLIIREIFMGSRRFDQFEAQLRIAPALLTARLKELEKAGIVSRTAYQKRPVRYEYRLTEKGRDVWPVIVALKSWGDKWGEFRRPPANLRHRPCGQSTNMRMVCSCCGEPIGPRNVDLELGPTMAAQRKKFAIAKRQKDADRAKSRRRN